MTAHYSEIIYSQKLARCREKVGVQNKYLEIYHLQFAQRLVNKISIFLVKLNAHIF